VSAPNGSSAACPVKGCSGQIKIPADLPAGIYDCVCKHARVRLSWITFADYKREPMLAHIVGGSR
jgi:hypothetical protein